MEPVSRRHFFKQAGAAAAVVGAATAVPLGMGTASADALRAEPRLAAEEIPAEGHHLVAHVSDARTGAITLFVGEKEITFHDRQVAARLVRASR
ncbi:MAG TPA: twin-arginine translocation signal domain-containing protein [Acidimicrobiales bacterium]|nr:twin-arginine translocation signal domain-containing protein [Acidimicrobiales bacterium]